MQHVKAQVLTQRIILSRTAISQGQCSGDTEDIRTVELIKSPFLKHHTNAVRLINYTKDVQCLVLYPIKPDIYIGKSSYTHFGSRDMALVKWVLYVEMTGERGDNFANSKHLA